MAYDTELIPIGYTAADVRAYYFDENTRNWIQVPPDTLIVSASALRSTTTHFTDYINGIIKVPEAPETMGYQPTSIKDLKIGDASVGITPLALPEASTTGAMSTRFPLKLPPGRQGMQPDLSLSYSSEGGHSWAGLGWNLSGVSQITIDTRWGVPRYDDSLETETYTLDGEMLAPVTHRSEWVARTGSATDPKIFHPRVEGSFRQIKRFGSDPSILPLGDHRQGRDGELLWFCAGRLEQRASYGCRWPHREMGSGPYKGYQWEHDRLRL
jgi:hypothetical protein